MSINMDLKKLFRQRLFLLCEETKRETGHTPQRLLNILNEVDIRDNNGWFLKIENLVQQNVNQPMKTEGIEYLYNMNDWKLSRFDLTIEAIIVENQDYRSLFDDKVIKACKTKLKNLGYNIKTP